MWRTESLPPGWEVIRQRVLYRDGYRCTWFPGTDIAGTLYRESYSHPYRCTNKATDVDHIESNNNHSDNNLRSLCKQHHNEKTSSLSYEQHKQKKLNYLNKFRTSSQKHPGLT
jgi:5-methylcytosine-specific restriction protein A